MRFLSYLHKEAIDKLEQRSAFAGYYKSLEGNLGKINERFAFHNGGLDPDYILLQTSFFQNC